MNDEIKDMSLNDEPEDKDKDKDKDKEITTIEDMSLDEESSDSKSGNFEARIKKLFPDEQYIYINPTAPIIKLDDGGYMLKTVPLKDLDDEWKKKVEDFLKAEEAKK